MRYLGRVGSPELPGLGADPQIYAAAQRLRQLPPRVGN